MLFQMQGELFRFDEEVCVCRTLNSDISSKFWGKCEFGGNPGEIPFIGWEISGSKGLK